MTFVEPPSSETALRTMISTVAESFGWQWMHIRPARTSRGGWITHVDGPLGVGWPDLFLVRGERAIVVETKTASGTISPDQARVMTALRIAGIETFVVTPDRLRDMEDVLR